MKTTLIVLLALVGCSKKTTTDEVDGQTRKVLHYFIAPKAPGKLMLKD